MTQTWSEYEVLVYIFDNIYYLKPDFDINSEEHFSWIINHPALERLFMYNVTIDPLLQHSVIDQQKLESVKVSIERIYLTVKSYEAGNPNKGYDDYCEAQNSIIEKLAKHPKYLKTYQFLIDPKGSLESHLQFSDLILPPVIEPF